MATGYIRQAFADLGVPFAIGARVSVDQCVTRFGVLDRHRRLVGRMFELLAVDGVVERAGDEWIVRRPLHDEATPQPSSDASERLVDGRNLAHRPVRY